MFVSIIHNGLSHTNKIQKKMFVLSFLSAGHRIQNCFLTDCNYTNVTCILNFYNIGFHHHHCVVHTVFILKCIFQIIITGISHLSFMSHKPKQQVFEIKFDTKSHKHLEKLVAQLQSRTK